jgi:predicted ABC-type ATPase
MTAPEAIVIAGPNGAGKTTFARQLIPLLHPGVPFFNVDEIQREGGSFSSPAAAAREFLRRLSDVEAGGRSLSIETTLASRSYVRHIRRWQSLGYAVTLHFIELPSADFAVARVAGRVALGGHSIPEADIRRRFARGVQLFPAVYQPLVDRWFHWRSDDNGLSLVRRHEKA